MSDPRFLKNPRQCGIKLHRIGVLCPIHRMYRTAMDKACDDAAPLNHLQVRTQHNRVERKEITLKNTDWNLADILTKPLKCYADSDHSSYEKNNHED